MSRILVTGGAGFIGYNFSIYAQSLGHDMAIQWIAQNQIPITPE